MTSDLFLPSFRFSFPSAPPSHTHAHTHAHDKQITPVNLNAELLEAGGGIKTGGGAGAVKGKGGRGVKRPAPDDDSTPMMMGAFSALLGMEDEDEEEDMADVQQMLMMFQHVMERKKAKTRERHAALLTELQGRVQAAVKEVEGELKKEARDLRALVKDRSSKLMGRLDKKMGEIKETHAQYEATILAQWEEYQAIYNELPGIRAGLEDTADKKRRAIAKRAKAMHEELSVQAARVEQQINAESKKKGALPPDFNKLLGALAAGADD